MLLQTSRSALPRPQRARTAALARSAPFTVDLARFGSAVRVRESWFDPRYGVTYEIHAGTPQAFQTYTPPTAGRGQDWVLLIEAVKD